MFKQPIFGEDSSPHQTSMFVSGIITLILWIIFCLMSFFLKFKPKTPEYKEVQIVLASTPVEEKQEESSSAAAASAAEAVAEPVEAQVETVEVPELPNPVETPVAQAKVEAVKETPAPAKTQTKTQTTQKTQAKTEPQPAKTQTTTKTTDPSKKVNFDDYQYATDYSDGVDFNNVSTKKQSFDWSQFDDSSSDPEPQVSQKVDKVTNTSSISGSAGETTTQKNQTQTSNKSTSTNTTPEASSATSSALSNIKNTQYSTSTGNSLKSITEAKTTKGSDGSISMAMIDGTTRVLLDPIPPVIKLSESAAALIDSTRTVTIEFQVLSSGNVPRSQIKITPESILPQEVRNEIYDQLSKWLFASSPNTARATFEYTIQKK